MNFIAIWTDGLGTYQAQCLGCDWKGQWRHKGTAAVKDAEQHECKKEGKIQ